jgi:hypothetical protein
MRRIVSRPAPLGQERHQDRLDIAPGHQAELRPAVVQQVKLDIASAANELVSALGVGPRLVLCRRTSFGYTSRKAAPAARVKSRARRCRVPRYGSSPLQQDDRPLLCVKFL